MVGLKGRKLATWMVGGVRCTTRAALKNFIDGASQREAQRGVQLPSCKQIAKAKQKLRDEFRI
jgi:hypothetical protein